MTELNPFKSDLLSSRAGVKHAFFSRHGGVSTGLLSSLNFSLSKGDTIENISQNRRRIADYYGHHSRLPLSAHQVHGRDVLVIEEAFDFFSPPKADGLITTTPNLVIGVQTADCIPLLLSDAQERIVGAIHVGWRGAYDRIIHEAIMKMIQLGSKVNNIYASIGPCIHQPHYEVDQSFFDRFVNNDINAKKFFNTLDKNDHYMFDLPGYAMQQLKSLGVLHYDQVPIDTYAHPDLYFSCRRAFHTGEPTYGCTLSTIMIES